MKVQDLIDILADQDPKSEVLFEYGNLELIVDEWSLGTGDSELRVPLLDRE